jgi:hypothetical protein
MSVIDAILQQSKAPAALHPRFALRLAFRTT